MVEYKVYKPSNTLTFYLTDEKTLVRVGSKIHSTFIVLYDHANYKPQLELLREYIVAGEIKSITQVVEFCNWRPGNNTKSQNYGLELRATKLERHICLK